MNWKPILGWPRYEASTTGLTRIRDTGRVVSQRVRTRDNYLVVDLFGEPRPDSNSGRCPRNTVGVNILVCMAFHGSRPSARYEAAHCNGKKSDISIDNLRWATPIENEHDKRQHRTSPLGERNGAAKITQTQAVASLLDRRTTSVIAAEYGIGTRAVRKIKPGIRWSSLQLTRLEAAA